jgi:hypothetical protein
MTATTSVTLQPKTVNLTFQSNPTGLQLTAGPTTARAPFTDHRDPERDASS